MTRHIGIYGGGQLGLYLCHAARRLGLQTTVLTPDASSPACSAADNVLQGSLGDPALARTLVANVDVITFEVEAVPATVLHYLAEADAKGQVEVAPGADTLLLLQNKARQKSWLRRHELPTAPFEVLHGGQPDADA